MKIHRRNSRNNEQRSKETSNGCHEGDKVVDVNSQFRIEFKNVRHEFLSKMIFMLDKAIQSIKLVTSNYSYTLYLFRSKID